jgi:phage/plasmid-like protein (TIGR03299 family)
MAHALEFVNGRASFAGRQPAWHALGTVIDDLTYAEAMREAHLADWNVRVAPLVANVDGTNFDVPNAQVVVRDNPENGSAEVLAAVGDRYSPVQNEDAFGFVPFLEDAGARVETAGSIRGGRQVFMSLSTDKGFIIDPNGAADRVENFLLLSTSHDGSLSIEASSTPVRVVCANTLDLALPRAKRAYKVRHTSTAQSRLAEAQALLVSAQGYFERFGELAASLYETEVTNAEFTNIITRFYPKPTDPKNKRGITVWERKVDTLEQLWSGGSDYAYTLGNVHGTAWGAVNALTERIDWHRPSRGKGNTLAIGASGFVAAVTQEKQRALEFVSSWAQDKKGLVLA